VEHRLIAAAAAAVVTRRSRSRLAPPAAQGRADRRKWASPGDGFASSSARWERTNHRGDPVSMLEGPATALGLLVGGVLGAATPRGAISAIVATTGAAAFGLVDDLTQDAATQAKGLRGHLGALARGTLTTGGLKVLGIGASSLLAAAIATPGRAPDGARSRRVDRTFDVATSGALIAATANLVNLLDLRPGRALKAAGLTAAAMALTGGAGAGLAAGVVGAALAAMPADLAERDMLGDGGANALGALLGLAVVLETPRPVRFALLAGAIALTVASERVSFTEVIARTTVLRELDALGRREGNRPA